ncbi:class I SAM-dependent methyltransferase [Methylorubrum sp. SB2]|uniref:class I SAM-dependent methyltransferase n=1 Tax=Methylorubrum subtropicum TaxID=3138812 RepID=UPI00313D5B36
MAEATSSFPDFRRFHHHRGANYQTVLKNAHAFLRPDWYLEVGVNTGSTITLAERCVIGVDPNFKFSADVVGKKEKLFLFQQTSDAFFAGTDVPALAGGPIDIAFLDGLHEAEVLLRDIFNTERLCGPNSVIFLHDCLPGDIYMARRHQFDAEIRKLTPHPATWTGDVWKALAILQKYRKDLTITCLDAGPTGLVALSNLDPHSTVLPDAYDDLFAEIQAMETTHETLKAFLAACNITSTARVASEAEMRETFGLKAA